MRHYLRAVAMGRNQWPKMLLALIGMLIDALTLLGVPLLIRRAVDLMARPTPEVPAILGRLALIAFGLAIFRAGGIYLEILMQETVGNRIGASIRSALFQKLLRLPFAYFDRTPTGDIMSRLTKDVDAVRDGTGFVVLITVVNAATLLGTILTMFLLHAGLTLAILAALPVMVLVIILYSRAVGPLYAEIERRSGSLHTAAQENISGIRVVKAFVRAREETAKFDRENEALFRANLGVARLNSLVNPCLDLFGTLLTMIVIGYGGYLTATGRLTLGMLLAFTSFVQFLYWPLRQTGWLADLIARALAGAERIFGVLDQREQPLGAACPAGAMHGRIEFQDVSFRYGDDGYSLRRFNLSIAPGERVAVIGGTGSGKTTVANLVARFYDPTEGRVLIDGRDLRDWPLEELRRQIGFVFQDNFLFSLTVRDNIALGRPEARQEDLAEAAEAAQIAGTIARLPQGYETTVGERGVGLSGGERQRLALARALLIDPRILILDDSTASLDAQTENAVQEALDRRAADKTVLIIAQRVATAMRADRIVVLAEGRIAEEGGHERLLAQNGLYTALYKEQMSLLEPVAAREAGVLRAAGG
ncbi:MAG: ABC transporter ATP-binding protein [Bacteroidota bacterium]